MANVTISFWSMKRSNEKYPKTGVQNRNFMGQCLVIPPWLLAKKGPKFRVACESHYMLSSGRPVYLMVVLMYSIYSIHTHIRSTCGVLNMHGFFVRAADHVWWSSTISGGQSRGGRRLLCSETALIDRWSHLQCVTFEKSNIQTNSSSV